MKITNHLPSQLQTSNLNKKSLDNSGLTCPVKIQKNHSLPSFGETGDSRSSVNTEKFKQYKKAQEYVEKTIKRFEVDDVLDIRDFDIDKLEGLQYGIKVFDGLSMRQIALLYNHTLSLCTSRGCSNGCVHCFADAKPVHIPKNDNENIKQMCWEDFSDFTAGIKELNRRMHCKNDGGFFNNKIAPFWDADCMEITMKDKNGKEYDITDVSEKIIKDMNKSVLFDTSGWTPKNQKMQARAQKFVDYIKDRAFKSGFDSELAATINISLHPFHKLNSKYVEYLESDPQRAKKFRELYTDRMANVFYTFTPVLNNVQVLDRVMEDDSACCEQYKERAHEKLILEIKEKLKEKYNNDSSMSKKDIKEALARYDYITSFASQNILPVGRGENLYHWFDYRINRAKSVHKQNREHPENILTNTKGVCASVFLLDANGRVYVTNHFDTVPTDIQLNFRNKNKKTPPFYSLIDRVVTTDELYNVQFERVLKRMCLREKED